MLFLVIFLNTSLKILSILGLTLYTFREKLRFSLRFNALLTFLMIMINTVISYFMAKGRHLEGLTEVFFTIAIIVLDLSFLSIFLKDTFADRWKLVFTIFLINSLIESIVLNARLFQNYFSNGMLEDLIMEHFLTKYGLFSVLFDSIFVVISSFCIFILLKYCLHPMLLVTGEMIFWKYLWCVPVTFYILFRLVVYPSYFNKVTAYYHYSLFFTPVWIIGLFSVYFIIIKMLFQTSNNLMLQKELELSSQQMELHKEHYQTMQRGFEEMRKVHHDVRHQLIVLQGDLRAHNLERLEADLNMQFEHLDHTEYLPFCANYAIDTILWHFSKLSKESGIEFEVHINIPNETFVSSVDLCILFGNLLENAYEACCRITNGKRFIKVKAESIHNASIAIIIKNSYNGFIVTRNHHFQSSKRPEDGIGLRSVQSTAEKYNGALKIHYKNNLFKVSVLLSDLHPDTSPFCS